MNKLLYIFAFAAMLFVTACDNDDEPGKKSQVKGNLSELIVKTMSGEKNISNSTCDIKFNFKRKTHDLSLIINNVSFAPQMPKISFNVNGLYGGTNDNIGISFSGDDIQVMDGYTLNDVYGEFDNKLKTLIMTYTVNTEYGKYDVITYSPILFSILPDGTFDYVNTTEKFYKFNSQIVNKLFTASICIDNIQFAPQMPKLEEIVIPLDDATIVQTAKGYTATAATIVPYFKQGDKLIPFSDRTITNLNYELNVRDHKFSIEFDCYGLHYTDNGYLYATHFNPFDV